MTVTGWRSAQSLKEMGATRVVTARELSLQEIAEIRDHVDVEIESFVHGALCYCYSGQCLLSSLIGGRSGNRGRCAQPCRLPYDVLTAAGKPVQSAAKQNSAKLTENIYETGKQNARNQNTGKKGKGKHSPDMQDRNARTKGKPYAQKKAAVGDDRYVLSLKDLCTLDILPDIIESGVYSLQIEGRMKSPRYTACLLYTSG